MTKNIDSVHELSGNLIQCAENQTGISDFYHWLWKFELRATWIVRPVRDELKTSNFGFERELDQMD